MGIAGQNSLQVRCKNELATLERLLRVVRFRGFSVVNFTASLDTDADQLHMELTLSGERPLHLLENQLRKNHEVLEVRVLGSVEVSSPPLGLGRGGA